MGKKGERGTVPEKKNGGEFRSGTIREGGKKGNPVQTFLARGEREKRPIPIKKEKWKANTN